MAEVSAAKPAQSKFVDLGRPLQDRSTVFDDSSSAKAADQCSDCSAHLAEIVPMMMKVDFASIRNVGRKPKGLLVALFVNWVVKPCSMAAIAEGKDNS